MEYIHSRSFSCALPLCSIDILSNVILVGDLIASAINLGKATIAGMSEILKRFSIFVLMKVKEKCFILAHSLPVTYKYGAS